MADTTIVHLLRHGEVHNPTGVLYGRLPDFHLSDLGRRMAERVAEVMADRDITVVTASPLERAQETAAPLAEKLGLPIGTDERLLEAGNHFEGLQFGVGDGSLKQPSHWRHLWNPFRPSWGEPYADIAARMHAAAATARDQARGHEAFLVSHQSPIWIARLAAEHRRLWHDPRKRQCSLASITSFRYRDEELVGIDYLEPALDLLPVKQGHKPAAGA